MKALNYLKAKWRFLIAFVGRSSAEYQVSMSHTCNSEKEIIFKTRYKFIFSVYYYVIKKYYKNKMFVRSRMIS
jgi:hypothetical protein